jgi:hypothetical protein
MVLESVLAKFQQMGVKFAVAGRDGASAIDDEWLDMFEPMQGSWDISSSRIRKGEINPDGTPTVFVRPII